LTHNESEQRLITTPLDTVSATFLLVRPPNGKIRHRAQFVKSNGAVADCRSERPIAPPFQDIEQLINVLAFNNDFVSDL
jgi:hypothetical protein